MRIFMFKSQAQNGLHAFAADAGGQKLPKQHGPWTATGIIAAGKDPPHRLSRRAIEDALQKSGFQLWRMKTSDAG